MKRILILIGVVVSIIGADWRRVIGPSDSAMPPEKRVAKSDSSGLFIRTTVFGFIEEDTTIDSKNFKRIEIPDEPIDRDTTRAGKPQIPYVRLLIAVPDSVTFNITTYESDYTLYEDTLIYPVPRIEFDDTAGCWCSKEVYTYDTTFYNKDTIYPGKFYELHSDAHWRDQRVIEVFLYPVQFNPKDKLIYFYNCLDLRIDYSGTYVENPRGLGPFEEIGREILLNYPGIDFEPGSVPTPSVHYYTNLDTNNVADYIIVTHEDFIADSTDSSWIHEFANWRVAHNKFDVGIVQMTDVYDEFLGGSADSAKALRDFLVYAYDNWYTGSISDSHFAYCLFIGDWDYVPSKLTLVADHVHDSCNWVKANEWYFKDISDTSITDFSEDIMLGRWPTKETGIQDVATIAQKTIDYEENPHPSKDWRRRGLLIAGGDFNSPPKNSQFNKCVDRSKPYFSDIGYDTITVRWPRDYLVWHDTLDSCFNQGEIIAAYWDHGAPEGWWGPYDTTNIKTLTNANHLPVVLSMACYTANFPWDHDSNTVPGYSPSTCFGEHFLFNSNGGCVAYSGATIYTGASRWVEQALDRALCYQLWILGKMLFISNIDGTYRQNYCLLGDPALDLGDYTAYPDLPDLVIRPRGIDISLENYPHYPYFTSGDSIPIQTKVLNIGGDTAFSVDVDIDVVEPDYDTVHSYSTTIDTILPLDSASVKTYWKTSVSHPNHYGEIGDCAIWAYADPDSEITESWELNNHYSKTEYICLYPSISGWPKKIIVPQYQYPPLVSQPEIANLNNTGEVEIAFVGLDSVYVFEYDGDTLNGWPQYFKDVYSIALGDLDDDDTIDIVAVSPDSVTAYDYHGNTMTGWPQPVRGADPDSNRFYGFPALGYISGSRQRQVVVYIGHKEDGDPPEQSRIMVYDYDGDSLYCLSHDSMLAGYEYASSGISISDVNNDTKNEMIVSYEKNPGFGPGELKTYTDIFNRDGLVDTLKWGNLKQISALVDISGDGTPDIITGGSKLDSTLWAYNERTGDTIWYTPTGGPIYTSPAAGDIRTGPGYAGVEIAFGNSVGLTDSGEIWAVRKLDGEEWDPPFPIATDKHVRVSPGLAKLEGMLDAYADIVICSDDWNMVALDWEGDTILPYPLPLFGEPSSPVIGDIDGNLKSETILASRDGYLHVWKNINSSLFPQYVLEWPRFHHDYQRTGLYNWIGGLGGSGKANPEEFSNATTISFSLEDTLPVQVSIYNTEGNLVKTLVNQSLPQGTYHPVWYGKDNNYALLPNGLYFIEFKVNNECKIIPVKINR